MSFENRMRKRLNEAMAMSNEPTLDVAMARHIIRFLISDCRICLRQTSEWNVLAQEQYEQLLTLKGCIDRHRNEARKAIVDAQKARAESGKHRSAAQSLSSRLDANTERMFQMQLEHESRVITIRRNAEEELAYMRQVVDIQRKLISALESPSSPPAPPLAPP